MVVFPAVRYLTATEREHSRRLKLRNLLLLILRTAVIVCLVLAAAHPIARIGVGGSHPPTALALVLDNSLSSGAVVEGRRTVDVLVEAARQVLERVGAADRLWLVLSDGVPRRLTRLEAERALDSVTPAPVRMDVSSAVRAVARAVADTPLPGQEVVLFSDLQASALSAGDPVDIRVLVWQPPPPPENRWIDSAYSDPPLWSPDGAVIAAVGGSTGQSGTVRLVVEGRDVARAVAAPGDRVALSGNLARRGWVAATVELDPDELRADDRRSLALNLTQPRGAAATAGAGRFVAEALGVLKEGGRAVSGNEVVLDDRPAQVPTVVFPPREAALLGALNRSLAARGVGWRLGEVLEGEWQISIDLGPAEGAAVFRRHRLVGEGPVVARVGDEPWLVRDGDVVLVGSRMDPDWTDLPVRAGFVPFVDFLINRLAAQETWIISAAPGEMVRLPASATALLGPLEEVPVPSHRWITAPLETGVYFLRGTAGDTVGALELNFDARESRLEPADQRLLRSHIGPDARVLDLRALLRELFRGAARADLTGLLLTAALLAALAEFAVSSSGARTELTA